MILSVLGIDLAPRHSGFCYIPPAWSGEMGELLCREVSYGIPLSLDERTKIQVMLNAAKVGLAMVSECSPHIIVVEDYAFSKHSSSTTMQAEIGGVVKSQIYLATNVTPEPIPSTRARSFMTGGLRGNRKGDAAAGIRALPAKKQVKAFLVNRGMAFETEDIMDAFVVAFYRYCDANGIPSMFAPIEEHEQVEHRVKRARRSRRGE